MKLAAEGLLVGEGYDPMETCDLSNAEVELLLKQQPEEDEGFNNESQEEIPNSQAPTKSDKSLKNHIKNLSNEQLTDEQIT